MRRSFPCVFVLLFAIVALGACDDDAPPTTPSPTPTATATFSGTLNRNGAQVFPFSVGANGQVTATVKELSSNAVPIGLSLGNWNGTTCQHVVANDSAVQGSFVTGNMSAAGDLCLRVYDASGNLQGAVTFKVDVVHPAKS